MATFERRGNKWRAAIKKARYSRVTKTFQRTSAPKAWAMKVEMQMSAEDRYIDEKEPVNPESGLAGGDFLGVVSVRLAQPFAQL